MEILKKLNQRWRLSKKKFIVTDDISINFDDLNKMNLFYLSQVKQGDVVALIGDFNPVSIISLINLLDKKVIVAPLTQATKAQHDDFFSILKPRFIIENGKIVKEKNESSENVHIDYLRKNRESGLIFFSSGTTGKPKVIIHQTSLLLKRFLTPRPGYTTLSFLMFDHMGGLNTLFHTIYNFGTLISTKDKTVLGIINICKKHNVEVLPTTPNFLRRILFSGLVPDSIPKSLKIITYGSEKMDQLTLNKLTELLPHIDFRQTYGLSEFSVLRVKSQSRESLFMKIGGEGVETKIIDNMLHIRSKYSMLGYLNEQYNFDRDDWFNTKDIVEEKDGYIKIIGRNSDIVNVGGLKFLLSEVSDVILEHIEVEDTKVYAKENYITGQHVEAIVQLKEKSNLSKKELKSFLNSRLPNHMTPKKILFDKIKINHRLKKA